MTTTSERLNQHLQNYKNRFVGSVGASAQHEFEMKKFKPIATDYISIPELAKKIDYEVADLLVAIRDHQIAMCIMLTANLASQLTDDHRSRSIDDYTKSLLTDHRLYPAKFPSNVCIPLDRNVIERMVEYPTCPPRVYRVAVLKNGQFVAYDSFHIKIHVSMESAILLKEHANQLLKLLSKGPAFDDPLTMRERGNMLRTVGALVDILLQSHAGGGTEDAVIRDILDTYPNTPGLSRSNLQKLFAQSKRALDREGQANRIDLP